MNIEFDKSEINKYNYTDKDKKIIFLKDQIGELNRQIKQLRNIIRKTTVLKNLVSKELKLFWMPIMRIPVAWK